MIAGKSVMQIMQRPGLSDFVQIISVAGLAQTFDNFNTLTVFAPTNEAIRRKFLLRYILPTYIILYTNILLYRFFKLFEISTNPNHIQSSLFILLFFFVILIPINLLCINTYTFLLLIL